MKAKRFVNARRAPASAGALLSIGGVAEATGLSVDTLRVWERRYGKPTATRLPSGHRRYARDQVRHLRRVAEGLALGHRPSKILMLSEADLDDLLASHAAGVDTRTTDLLALVRTFRAAELTETLRREWQELDPATFLQSRVAPLLAEVGRLWADGELQIRHEHFLTEVLENLLRSLRLGLLPEAEGEVSVVLATLPGETHDLGLQMLALLCALRGVSTHLLGPDTPITEMVRAQLETGARAVLVSVSLANGGVDTDRQLTEVRARVPAGVHVLVGGAGARGPRRGPRGVEYLDDLQSFQDWLSALLDEGPET